MPPRALLFMAIVLATVLVCDGSLCDSNIKRQIEELWTRDLPRDIIDSGIFNGKEVVLGTTEGYYTRDTRCLFSFFTKESFTSIRVLKEGCPSIDSHILEEMREGTFDPVSNTRMLHVLQENGVTAFYKCSIHGEEGKPEGLVKVSSAAEEYDQSVKKAKKILQKLGIKITVDFPSICP